MNAGSNVVGYFYTKTRDPFCLAQEVVLRTLLQTCQGLGSLALEILSRLFLLHHRNPQDHGVSYEGSIRTPSS